MQLKRDNLAELKKGLVPVTITWNRDAILDFLLKQYKDGNEEASELLCLQLHNDVRACIAEKGIDPSKEAISNVIKSYTDYPDSVLSAMIRDFETGEVEFTSPILKDPEESADELPF